jgi:hypothetical protein
LTFPQRRLLIRATIAAGPLHNFYEDLLAQGKKPTMARLTLERKIAEITLIIWKKEARFDAEHLKRQAVVGHDSQGRYAKFEKVVCGSAACIC